MSPAPSPSPESESAQALCQHCGQTAPSGAAFCCNGCAGAYALIEEMGLESYYRTRVLDENVRPPVPIESARADLAHYVRTNEDGTRTLHLMVEGMHCAACVWLIEKVLERQPGVRAARINMTTRRLTLSWEPSETNETTLADSVTRLGYRIVPYDPSTLGSADKKEEKELLLCLAVAGFAASNVMLFSVSLWAGAQLEPATRALMQWYSALLVLPASAFAIRPFARPAWEGLKNGRVTMDFPITLAVVLTMGMSVYESIAQTGETYFEAAASLLFFLLVGRYLDRLVRSRALSCAEDLTLLRTRAATVVGEDGAARSVPAFALTPSDILLVARGETIAADGIVVEGVSTLDRAVVTGESLPVAVRPGEAVPSGAVNLDTPLRIKVTASGEHSTLGRMAALAENAALAKNRYTRLADRAARFYAPAVHGLAFITLAAWWLGSGDFHLALTHAVAVLIVTCPCAIALAIPAVQVAAASTLLRAGVLLKRPEALEKLEEIDAVVWDKTGTLTTGHFQMTSTPHREALQAAARLAASSTHPLSRALLRAAGPTAPAPGVHEIAGQGLSDDEGARLGTADFCAAQDIPDQDDQTLLYYRDAHGLFRFSFTDALRPDAAKTVQGFADQGIESTLLSGDREGPVRAAAQAAGIGQWLAQATPQAKHDFLQSLQKAGRRILMIGDGINDAPALAAAHVSMSSGSAADISRNAADIVLQGEKLGAALATLRLARAAMHVARQNFALSIAYNLAAVPMAMAGLITPLWAALFMSASSITVMLNALRLARRNAWTSLSS